MQRARRIRHTLTLAALGALLIPLTGCAIGNLNTIWTLVSTLLQAASLFAPTTTGTTTGA
jgi:hypothetical protein